MRVCIVGTGGIAPIHARLARELGGEVVAVVGRTAASARASGLGAPFATLADAVRTARPDVVHVCTPHETHAEIATAALAAGLPVVCEKPLATTLEDALRLVEAAQRAGVVAATAYTYRGYPLVQALRAEVAAGGLGELRRVGGCYLSQDAFDPAAYLRQMTPGVLPAYALLDLGVHWLDLVEHVTGRRIVELSAQLATHVAERRHRRAPGAGPRPAAGARVRVEVEEQADLLLRLEGGAVGSATISAVAVGHPNTVRLELDGSRAGADWEQPVPNTLRLRTTAGTLLRERDPATLPPGLRALSTLPAGHPEGYVDAFRNVVGGAWAAIRGEAAEYPTFLDGARGVRLVEACLASARRRGAVDVSDR